MDHFNATVKGGKLVKTRRGLQVSRQRFNGLSFVNASPEDAASGPNPSREAWTPSSAQHQIKFVEDGNESQSEGSYKRDIGRLGSSVTEELRARRQTTRKEKLPAASPAKTPSRLLPTPFGDQSFQLEDRVADIVSLWISPTTSSLATGAPEGDVAGPESPLSDDDWALFKQYLEFNPSRMYPYEDVLAYNPARGTDLHAMVTGDRAAMHCLLMCGSISSAVSTSTEPRDLGYHISKTCAILNQKLSQQHAVDAVILHCITNLAFVGYYVGRLDHWHLHMRGLRKVLELNGGSAGLPPWLVAEMHKADCRGAVALASTPYLAFTRQYSPISGGILSEVHEQVSISISALLSPLLIHSKVIEALSSLATLASAIRRARQSAGTVVFDPHAFTEEWQAITYALLAQPWPLRELQPDDPSSMNPYSSTTSNPTDSPTEVSYISDHRLLPFAHIAPSVVPSAAGPLEPALRIAALLYLKELLPDWPRNIGGYAVLLSLLRRHLAEVIQLHSFSELPGRHASTPPSGARAPTIVAGSSSSTPRRGDKKSSGPLPIRNPAPAPAASPIIAGTVFLCLVGDTACQVVVTDEKDDDDDDDEENGNDDEDCGNDRYPRNVYRDCLRRVAGLADEKAVDALTEDRAGGGLSLAWLFELSWVFSGNEGGGGQWEAGEVLKRIIHGERRG
ncbi:hypothetical protein C7999DRAFT_39272 [Corynascus novoguineensis]|uniref:Uncharacterized protein n=1 Tax=Corynascus novoguineensis TaxID=1126955 RepID=A0AAN7CZ49_9PEZI|nr:hypothetical protein C7999DRAFT_39272 [Corynascus novoguineensis]